MSGIIIILHLNFLLKSGIKQLSIITGTLRFRHIIGKTGGKLEKNLLKLQLSKKLSLLFHLYRLELDGIFENFRKCITRKAESFDVSGSDMPNGRVSRDHVQGGSTVRQRIPGLL